ncbi:MAG: RagB/SusD family nutrient uptake outer membrane protein [Candidatus Pedobacter colombiensis]|uniref:RagB/SusD family nutrient uptake outer membrane protein n=1 Tax=Candidatus Pedobacter colombiensis TaxID=3121371 RepID=A0AAJ6B613_9SPHI|nr:RagB/SusD family nutrient uptake outer membrane protein [Pedobacter sp.]WEK18061.1 MAG: RagB/SusD family nutrient uptake outer membrane protein [Pedobacter sp.]
MKRILYSIAILGMALTSSSCKKFLNPSPTDFSAPKDFFRNEAEVNGALTGIYDVLGKSATYGRYMFYEMDVADDSFINLSNWTQDLGLYNYSPSDTKLTDSWTALYNGINRANMLIENIDKAVMDKEKKKIALGEAIFLRAYYHFILTNNWGNVPLKTASTKSGFEVNYKNSPYKVNYDFIVSEMEKAADMVAPHRTYTYGSRVTQSVVWGILARVNLKMAGAPLRDVSRYAEVIKWAQKVKQAGHTLNPNYKQVFINMSEKKYDLNEVIWEVEFGKRNGTQVEEGSVGVINGIAANENIGYSYGAKHVTNNFYNSFDSDDLRRDWNINTFSYSADVEGGKVAYSPTQLYNRGDAKWRREYENTAPKFNGTSTINFPILRYSDVLLMLAEAENEVNGVTSIAVDAVNEVKRRAHGKLMAGEVVKSVTITNGGAYTKAPTAVFSGGGGGFGATATVVVSGGKISGVYMISSGSGYTSAPVITLVGGEGAGGAILTPVISKNATNNYDLTAAEKDSPDNLRTAIRKERSLELCFEGLRRFDLVRWGQFYSAMKNYEIEIANTKPATGYDHAIKAAKNVSERDTLFAIPAAELNSNRDINQNKGW